MKKLWTICLKLIAKIPVSKKIIISFSKKIFIVHTSRLHSKAMLILVKKNVVPPLYGLNIKLKL